MKYSLDGFSQNEIVELDLDDKDTRILRWFVDFKNSNNMITKTYNNEIYFLVKYSAVIKEFPAMKISERNVSSRFMKFKNCGLLKKKLQKTAKGTLTYFCFNEELLKKIEYNPDTYKNKQGVESMQTHQQIIVNGFENVDSHLHFSADALNNPSTNLNPTTNYTKNSDKHSLEVETIKLLVDKIIEIGSNDRKRQVEIQNINSKLDKLLKCSNTHQQKNAGGNLDVNSKLRKNDEYFKITSKNNTESEIFTADINNTDKDKIKAAVSVYYDSNCFSNELWEKLEILFTHNSFTEEMIKQYITYIQEKVEVKKPDSKINYFYSIVTKPSFVGQFLEEIKTKSEKIEKINAQKVTCSSCKTSYNYSVRRCPNCDLDVNNNESSEFIAFHKALLSLSQKEKDALNIEKCQLQKKYIGVSNCSDNFNDELRKLYRKYGLSHPIAKIGGI